MAYMPTTPLDPADRIVANWDQDRMPYILAVPLWITLALVAWSPFVLVFRTITS